jgi:hypothetical protein
MQRVANGTQSPTLPAPAAPSGTPGYFSDQNDGAAEATIVDPDWVNDIQEEICNVITAAGITLNVATRNQLLSAIQSLIATGSGALLTDTGLANAYVLTPAIAITEYSDGYTAVWKAVHANTGASTVNVSALGPVAIVHRDGSALQDGDIPAGSVCRGVFIGGVCQLEDAIPTLATTTLEGLVQLATNAQADARSATSVALTPSNLASLFAQSLGPSGFQRLPGGLIMQWAETPSLREGDGAYNLALPTTWPNNFFGGWVSPVNAAASTLNDNWPQLVTSPGAGSFSAVAIMEQAVSGATAVSMPVCFWGIGN